MADETRTDTDKEIEYYRMAFDFIEGHDLGVPEAGDLARAVLDGDWKIPGCCYGHGLEQVRAGTTDERFRKDLYNARKMEGEGPDDVSV